MIIKDYLKHYKDNQVWQMNQINMGYPKEIIKDKEGRHLNNNIIKVSKV